MITYSLYFFPVCSVMMPAARQTFDQIMAKDQCLNFCRITSVCGGGGHASSTVYSSAFDPNPALRSMEVR